MKSELRNNKDFWAGITFFITGAIGLVIAWGYPFGTTLRMGPGYFPVVLSIIMMVFGLITMLKGLRRTEKIKGTWSIRAMILLPLSLVLFGVLMRHAGFLPALVVLIFGSAAAGREFKFFEVLMLTGLLTLLSYGVFIWGMGLPYPLFRSF
jgi:uncharacterized membrane protein